MGEMKTGEKARSETLNKPSKRQRWFEFPSDLPHHLGTDRLGELGCGVRKASKKEQVEGAPQAPARTMTRREFTQTDNRQTKALRED